MKIKSILNYIEQIAPRSIQENWDNSGVQVGDENIEAKGILLCTDVCEATIDEAIQKGTNLIISHHPLIFGGVKQITGKTAVERIIIKALKNDIVVYSAHTNMDKCLGGVSFKMAERLGLKNVKILIEEENSLMKVVTYVPENYAEKVKDAMWNAGAGCIGKYDQCSYNLKGEGTFRAQEGCNPYVGQINKLHAESEIRIEVIVEKHMIDKVVNAIKQVHPYEEPAIDIILTANKNPRVGLGCVGETECEIDEKELLMLIKNKFDVKVIRHSILLGKKVKKVALCGGAGADFIKAAIASGADMYITGDIKYHEFATAENQIVIADIGHFESEQYTKEIFYEQLSKKFINFAILIAESDQNPILYT